MALNPLLTYTHHVTYISVIHVTILFLHIYCIYLTILYYIQYMTGTFQQLTDENSAHARFSGRKSFFRALYQTSLETHDKQQQPSKGEVNNTPVTYDIDNHEVESETEVDNSLTFTDRESALLQALTTPTPVRHSYSTTNTTTTRATIAKGNEVSYSDLPESPYPTSLLASLESPDKPTLSPLHTLPHTSLQHNTASNTPTKTTSPNILTDKVVVDGVLIGQEERESGDVDWKVYKTWISYSGGSIVVGSIFILYILNEFVSVLASWWLSYWSENK